MDISNRAFSFLFFFVPWVFGALLTLIHIWNPSVYRICLSGLFAYQAWFIQKSYRTKNHSKMLTSITTVKFLALYLHLMVHWEYESSEQYKVWHFYDSLVHLLLVVTTILPVYIVKGFEFEFGDKVRIAMDFLKYFVVPLNFGIIAMESSRYYGNPVSESLFFFFVFDLLIQSYLFPSALVSDLKCGRKISLRKINLWCALPSISLSPIIVLLVLIPQTKDLIMAHNLVGHFHLASFIVSNMDQLKLWSFTQGNKGVELSVPQVLPQVMKLLKHD